MVEAGLSEGGGLIWIVYAGWILSDKSSLESSYLTSFPKVIILVPWPMSYCLMGPEVMITVERTQLARRARMVSFMFEFLI